MKRLEEIIFRYQKAERDGTFPFSEWQRKDIFERLVKDFLIILGYNPDQINYDDSRGVVELEICKDLRAIIYVSSIQEEKRFLANKISAPIDTIPDPETGKPEYEIACVTNFEKWFFYFDGKEVYAVAGEKLEEEFDAVKSLLSRSSIESGKSKEVARALLHKEDNEPLRQELNILRVKIADKILQEKTNIQYLKNPDGTYNNEILNEITTRWITRFLALKLAEDSGIFFNFTLRDIRRSFELHGKTAKPLLNAKVKEETLSNAIRALMSEFERRYNGGIFMYEEGVDYITVPDSAFFDLLDFVTGWAFTIEDARIIGFVYERFLGQEIVVEEKKGKPKAVLKNIGEARGRRKTGGIYYTPKYIVDYIIENTLGEILNQKRKEIESTVKNLDCEKFVSTLREVKSLKVLDPACGSGSFLIKVLAEFKNFYEEIKEKAKELRKRIDSLRRERVKGQMLFIEDNEILDLENKYADVKKEIEEIKFSGTFALRHNIYGVDLDLKAIDITAFTLMVQVYDELKEGARCPTMIGENLKVGNSLVAAITPEEKEGFISRKELEEKFKEEIAEIIKLRSIEKGIDFLDDSGLRKLVKENFDEVVEIYRLIKEKYPNAIPTAQQKLLDEWHKRAKKEPIEKTFDVLITQTGLARIFLKEVFFEKIRKVKERIEFEINRPLIRYFNSEKRVLKDKELKKILEDERKIEEELRFVKDRATEISKSQPPKAFNWELEFPEVFFSEDGTLKENPGFDCVVGNPPWGRIKELPERSEKTMLSKYFRSGLYKLQRGNINLYKLFLEGCYEELKNLGFFSMIWPATFLGESDSIPLRIKFFENATVKSVLHFPVPTVYELFDKQLIMEATILTYQKQRKDDYEFSLKTEITIEEAKNLNQIMPLKLKRSQLKTLSKTYQVPIFKDMEKEWKILDKLAKYPTFGNVNNGNPIADIGDREGHLHETENKDCFVNKPADLVIREPHIRRYYVDMSENALPPRWCNKKKFLKVKRSAERIIKTNPKLIGRAVVHREEKIKLHFTYLNNESILSNSVIHFIILDNSFNIKFVLGLLNSSLLNWIYKFFSYTFSVKRYEIESLPIVRATLDQQTPIISLVDAIIRKKKEYHVISQNIEDYIDFKKANLIRLDEFLKSALDDFDVISSLKAKHNNFDALRLRIEGDRAIVEYGIKRKVEEYEEIGEDKQTEVRGKYIVEWYPAGEGRIKDGVAVEFLTRMIEKEKRFSKAKTKTIWQKIAEVKVSEFTSEIKEGFLKYKSTMKKAKKLDEEITRIDRSIDRLVYDLYGLTEDEIKVVERSVWGKKFEEMYSKLPSKEDALKLAWRLKNEQ